MEFFKADAVEEIAENLIRTIPEHSHLAHARIAYRFREKAATKGGKIVYATMRKCPERFAALAKDENPDPNAKEFDFFLEVAFDSWQNLTDHQKHALVDHELCHAFGEENEEGFMEWSTLPHDFEGFVGNVKRYGLWDPQYESAREALNS